MSGSRADRRRREVEQGDQKNLPFVGRVSGQVRLYGENKRGGLSVLN